MARTDTGTDNALSDAMTTHLPFVIGLAAVLLFVAGALGWKLAQQYYIGGGKQEDEASPPRDSFADTSRRTGPGFEPGVISGTIDDRYLVVRRG
jgi:hypothetical protein